MNHTANPEQELPPDSSRAQAAQLLGTMIGSYLFRVSFESIVVALEFTKPEAGLDAYQADVHIEGDFRVVGPTGAAWAEEYPHDAAQYLLPLVEQFVVDVSLEADGGLTLGFEEGTRIQVLVNGVGEPWQWHGPDAAMLVCMPSGGIAVWPPVTDRATAATSRRAWWAPWRDSRRGHAP